ncbi:hypothetical protein B0H14DRAFT_3782692 [Mycena olivaceomarginata]|nr:hypothetical protein B0H14DRAFT_3782692 [Mycena olivaceomarginata]
MIPAILPVQELWDQIVDELHQSRKDLEPCTLVCRALVARGQSYTFRYIHLMDGLRVNRLGRLLTSSPHLIPHIRHLSLRNCGAESFIPLQRIPWSNVETLTLMDPGPGFLGQSFDRSAYEALYTLVELPSVWGLNICGPFWDAMELYRIFSHCTPSLQFIQCHLNSMPDPLTVQPIQKPKIRRLGSICRLLARH